MNKKGFYLLLSVMPFCVNPVAAAALDPSPIVSPATEKVEPSYEAIPIDEDYAPPLQDYFILELAPLGLDGLANLGTSQASPLKISLFNLNSGLRFPVPDFSLFYVRRMGQSRFSLCFGAGLSKLKYALKPEEDGQKKKFKALQRESLTRVNLVDADQLTGGGDPDQISVRSSRFEVRHFDFLLRLRFSSILDSPKEGFHGFAGVKLGIRTHGEMTLGVEEYRDAHETRTFTGSFGMPKVVVVGQVGLGYSHFGLLAGYHFTPLFNEKKGPDGTNYLRPSSLRLFLQL